MNTFLEIVTRRRNQLIDDINDLCDKKINSLNAIAICYEFVATSTKRSEFEFDQLPVVENSHDIEAMSKLIDQEFYKISLQGRINNASSLIPDEFSAISNNYINTQNKNNLKFFNFIYHQFFISIIGTLDDFFSQIMLLILKAYPEKLDQQEIKIKKINFSDLSGIQSSNDLFNSLKLCEEEYFINLLDGQIASYVRELMHKNAIEYLSKLEKFLGDSDLLRLEKLTYSEMCLRRNAGIHSGWIGNEDYNQMIKKIKKMDTGNELTLLPITTNFLGFDAEYFCQSFRFSEYLINKLRDHCENKFHIK